MSTNSRSVKMDTSWIVLKGLIKLGLVEGIWKRFGASRAIAPTFRISGTTYSAALHSLVSSGYIFQKGQKAPYLKLTPKGRKVANSELPFTLEPSTDTEGWEETPEPQESPLITIPFKQDTSYLRKVAPARETVPVDKVIFDRLRNLLDLGESGFALTVAREMISDHDERTAQ